jgi:UDP-GlcNAc:undecaprenyl-phosphate GlcNAc-1-phosphate transferase
VISIRIGAVDVPKDRKVHLAPTPTLGGVAIFGAILVGFGIAAALPPLRSAFRFSEVFGLLVGGFVPLVLGVADDRRELAAPAKLAGQIFAAGIVYFSGLQMSFFWLPGIGVLSLSPDLSAILTILWIVLLMNAVNFIDGLDGLAAGLTAISASALFVYCLLVPPELLGPDPLAPLVAAIVAGACLGFLPHNFNPARIFMGDSGAMPLGFLLAGTTISLVGRTTSAGPSGGQLALPVVFMPLVLLALPITDLLFAIVRRVATGRAIYTPDKEHIHHRLMRLGHSHRQAVLVMYGWALLGGGGLVVIVILPWSRFLLTFALAAATVALFTMAPRLRRGLNGGPHASDESASAASTRQPV